jgi:hypothetical protein
MHVKQDTKGVGDGMGKVAGDQRRRRRRSRKKASDDDDG